LESLSEGGAARRALDSATEEVEALRRGDVIPGDPRRPVLRIVNAVDRSLRRILRDDPAASLDVRLKALAPDEIRIDAVLSELRRNERIPMELAAGIHELLESGRRLEAGGELTEGDRARAVRIADALKVQIDRFDAAPRSTDETVVSGFRADSFATATMEEPWQAARGPGAAVDSPLPAFEEPADRRRRARGGPPVAGTAITLALLAALGWAGYRYMGDRGPSEMDQARTLFENGQFDEAAALFESYAAGHPDDVTPHLFLARIHRRLDEPELAAEAIREAERIAPGDPAVHRELGFLLLDSGQPNLALSRFSTAIDLDSSSMEGWVGLARALRESGRRDEIATAIANAPAEVRALLTPADTL